MGGVFIALLLEVLIADEFRVLLHLEVLKLLVDLSVGESLLGKVVILIRVFGLVNGD